MLNTFNFLGCYNNKCGHKDAMQCKHPFFFLFIVINIIHPQVGNKSSLTIYQEKVKAFENFMRNELVDETIIENTIEDYKYLWKNRDVGTAVLSLNSFHDHLRVELLHQLYGSTLDACGLFARANNSFYRQLSDKLKEDYFGKDSEIIRCNDIRNLVHIVKKGKVDVMLGNHRLCSLGKGGMFGCFQKHGKMRQTITAVAKVHVTVLTLPCDELHKVRLVMITFT